MKNFLYFIILSLYTFFLDFAPKGGGFGPGLILLWRILLGIFIGGLIFIGLVIFGVISWIN